MRLYVALVVGVLCAAPTATLAQSVPYAIYTDPADDARYEDWVHRRTAELAAAHGAGVSPNLTLQGVHDVTSNNETGSVSAASPTLADYIGGAFSFDAKKGLLTISPRKG